MELMRSSLQSIGLPVSDFSFPLVSTQILHLYSLSSKPSSNWSPPSYTHTKAWHVLAITSLRFIFLYSSFQFMKWLSLFVDWLNKMKDLWEQRPCLLFFILDFQFIEQCLALIEWFCWTAELSGKYWWKNRS